jgi:hypothetical protein
MRDPQGRILLGGVGDPAWGGGYAVARLNADGSLDTGFGGDSKLITPTHPTGWLSAPAGTLTD